MAEQPGVRRRRRRVQLYEVASLHLVLAALALAAAFLSAAGQALPACGYLQDQKFKPAALSSSVFSSAPFSTTPLAPFRKELTLRFVNESVYYRDVNADGDPTPIAIRMDGFSDVYTSWDEMSRNMRGSLFSIFEGLGTPPEEMYRQKYGERTFALYQSAVAPQHLDADDGHVVWVDCDPRAPAAAGCWYELQVLDATSLAFVSLSLPAASQRRVHRLEPAVCGPYVAYRELDAATNASSVWIYYLATRSAELLGAGATGASPRAFFGVNAGSDPNAGPDDVACRLMWLETGRRLVQGPDGLAVPDGPADDVTLHLLAFPGKERTAFRPAEWRTGPYTALQGATVSSTRLAVSVARPDGTGYALRTRGFAERAWREVGTAAGPAPIVLADTAEDGFLFWTPSGAAAAPWSLQLVKYSGGPADLWFESHCVAIAGAPYPYAVALYHDILLFATSDVASGGRASLYRLDLDKDNDHVFDAIDVFPLSGDFWWDSDNDGIGDSADVIPASGPCVSSAVRGACMDDNDILYIAYAIFMLLLIAACATYWVYESRDRKRKAQDQALAAAVARDRRASSVGASQLTTARSGARSVASRADRSSETEGGDEATSSGDPASLDEVRSEARSSARRASLLSTEPELRAKAEEIAGAVPLFKSQWEVIGWACQTLILLLVFVSVIIAIIPLYNAAPLPTNQQRILIWFDFVSTSLFAVDLVMRCLYRDRELHPSVLAFLRANWYDVPSLITDIPAVTTVGVLQFAVLTRLGRIMRILRILKVVRVVRLYRRLTHQNFFILLLMEKPMTFLSILTSILIVLVAIWIKILEQDSTPDFEDIANVFWFSFVTLCTIGYGDIVPVNIIARLLSIALAIAGIGLLGAISAKMVIRLLRTKHTEMKLESQKEQLEKKRKSDRENMERILQEYNPMNVLLGENRTSQDDLVIRDFVEGRLRRAVTVQQDDIMFPLEGLMQGGGGKFGGGPYDMFSAANRHSRMLSQAAMLRDMDEITPGARVKVILRFHGLDRPADVGGLGAAFERAWLDVCSAILPPSTPNGHYLERLFTIFADIKNSMEAAPELGHFELTDPLHEREVALDDAIARHKMWKHVATDLEAMRRELVVVMVLWERYLAADWAVANLRYKVNVRPSPPAVNGRFAREMEMLGFGEQAGDHKDAGAWMNTIRKVVETRKVLQQMNHKKQLMKQSGKWGASTRQRKESAGASDSRPASRPGSFLSEASQRSEGSDGSSAGAHGTGGHPRPSIPALASVPEAGQEEERRRSIVFSTEEAGAARAGAATARGKSILRPTTARKYATETPSPKSAPENAADAIAVAASAQTAPPPPPAGPPPEYDGADARPGTSLSVRSLEGEGHGHGAAGPSQPADKAAAPAGPDSRPAKVAPAPPLEEA